MGRELRRYIIPNILAMIGTSCYLLADTFFIALAAGSSGITALNLVLPVYGIIFTLGAMVGVGSATRYSLDRSTDGEEAQAYFFNAIVWTILISLPFVAAGIFCPEAVLQWMGADADILSVGLEYTTIVLCFAPFFMLNFTFTAFVRNDGAPKIAMAATLTSGIFNIIFDYLLMFPMKMGMAGAALATGLSPIVSILVCMTHYLSKRNSIRLIKGMPSPRKLVSACTLGVVAFVGEIASGITTMIFNFLLLDLGGNIAVAAYGVIANTALVGTALFNGVSQGLQPLASEMHGRGDLEAERRIYRHALQIGVGIAVVLVAVVLLFADTLVRIFNSEGSQELAAYAVTGMRLYFLGFLVASLNIVRAGFYSAVGKGLESGVIAISRGVVAIGIFAFILSKMFGITGVWLAFPVSELVTLILTSVMVWGMGKARV